MKDEFFHTPKRAIIVFTMLSVFVLVSTCYAIQKIEPEDISHQGEANTDIWIPTSRLIEPDDEDPLPDHVPVVDGELSVFADWDQAQEPADGIGDIRVPIYMINRSEKHYKVTKQDWYSYFMLEVKVDGEWKRAQTFRFSWCGNSYLTWVLPSDSHMTVSGYYPLDGTGSAPARFRRVYEADMPVVTNEGTAKYHPEQIELAKLDPLAIATADAETVLAILNGELKPTVEDHYPGKLRAAHRLGEVDREAAKALRDRLMGELMNVDEDKIRLIEALQSGIGPEEPQAATENKE